MDGIPLVKTQVPQRAKVFLGKDKEKMPEGGNALYEKGIFMGCCNGSHTN